jgi:hypothetical protein
VLRESILVSAQVLSLASACITQQEMCSLQGTRQSTISYGPKKQQYLEGLVWSAMFCIGRINSQLALVEGVNLSTALSPAHWEMLVAAAAEPKGSGDPVLATCFNHHTSLAKTLMHLAEHLLP